MNRNKIAITTGDPIGVGEEITYKALKKIAPDKNNIIIIGKDLGLGFETIEIKADSIGEYSYKMLETACGLANKGLIKGLVTAPVSKEQLHKAGYFYNGQTEILEKLLKEGGDKAEMLFIARDLRVMLLTRHLPLSEIKITKEMIIEKTLRLNKFLSEKCKIKSPKIALCAINPHAGENGILGGEEKEIMTPASKYLREKGINITDPLSADALFGKIGKKFLKDEKQEFDGVIAAYHDQGLCPVKALCYDEAVNTTIGLKIIRTSPPTGTAYDIAGKNIANPSGMISAIELLQKLV